MSSKLKKRSSDMSFSLSRWFRRLSTTTPTTLILVAVGIGYCLFLMGGGLYTIITHPPPAYLGSSNIYFLYPSISGQFVSDTIIAVILYAFGFLGLFTMYQSTKNAYKPRQAYILLIIGVTFLALAYLFLEGSISFKSSGGA